jgi:hypothetical protein
MGEPWFSVRCLFHDPDVGLYEERITLWQANSFERAIEQAEREANEYAEILDLRYVGLAQAYHLGDEAIESGSEVVLPVPGQRSRAKRLHRRVLRHRPRATETPARLGPNQEI